MRLFNIMKSWWCKGVFIIGLIGAYLILPSKAFVGHLLPLSLLFMITFSFSLSCTTKNIKEKTKAYRGSTLGLIGSVIGIGALHTCTMSGFCATATVGIVSAAVPAFIQPLLKYHVYILGFAVLIQIGALMSMHCFRK